MVRLSHKSWHAADIFYLDQVDIFDKKTILGVARLNIARWYNDVEKFKHDGFNKVIETFYFEERLTNVSAESFNALFLIVVSHQSGISAARRYIKKRVTFYCNSLFFG